MHRLNISRRWAVVISVLLVLLCASAAIIVKQGQRILRLEASLRGPQSGTLPEGAAFGPLTVADLGGKAHSIDFGKRGSKPVILYFLRPGCVWCRRNSRNISLLASRVAGEYDLIGLSFEKEGLEDFVREEHIGFPVYTDIPNSAVSLYQLGTTPETIVVSAEGTVVKSWIGAYTQDPVRTEVEKFFSLRFPANLQASQLN